MSPSKLSLYFAVLLIAAGLVYPQELFLPKEINNAYKKETRSFDGKPGEKYWQNFSFYDIDASINPAEKKLMGHEVIKYSNFSPDTLKKLVFKLYQNMNKKDAARNIVLEDAAITDGMSVWGIKINDSDYDDQLVTVQGTNMILNLAEALPPKGKVTIEMSWSFTIPHGSNPRMGAYDSSSFFLGYWYPKISVYDDLKGWDLSNYDGEHEFYSEYADYNVNITMPEGFIVWATGEPVNLKEILSDEIMNRYRKASVSDTVAKIITKADLVKKNIFKKKGGNNTWKFSAVNVPDFAFGTSPNYVWQMTTKKMSGRIILVQTAFDPNAAGFNDVIHFAKGAVDQFPDILPGVAYPYPQLTIFHGDSGMEFPMIVNDGVFPNRATDVYVTIHEATHNFFPFYVGVNETMYGWFDEGMAYFLPQKIQLSFDPSDHRVRAAKGYSIYAGKETDVSLMTPNFFVREPDLSYINYYKAGIALDMLSNVLGEDVFKKCLFEFMNRWNGKHSTPYDFFYTFNNVSGQDLNWFWKEWYFERGLPDLSIKEVTSGGKVSVLIEKKGNYPVPIHITLTSPDGRKEIIEETAKIWSDGRKETWVEAPVTFDPITAELGAPWIPDSNPADNRWEQK